VIQTVWWPDGAERILEMSFPTTQWTLLTRASLNGESAGHQALEELCRRYWLPLYQFLRARGCTRTEAQDLTQEFLLHLFEHATLQNADRARGRFRSFLLGALVRFLADERDRRYAWKRGRGALHLSLESAGEDWAAPGESADLFDREWALVILENALRQVQEEVEAGAQALHFTVLRQFLPGSIETPSYEAAAAQLGLTLAAFKSELHRLRQRFKALVRQEVAQTVSAPHEIAEEMEHLQRVLMDKGHDYRAGVKLPAARS
jgi:DNA-directed RNA polymerase specialized sigma24 family protein